jgi:hypothetical protein
MYIDFELIIFAYVLCCALLFLFIEFKQMLTYEDRMNFINHSLKRIPLL